MSYRFIGQDERRKSFDIPNALSSDNFKEVGEKKLSFVIGHTFSFPRTFQDIANSNIYVKIPLLQKTISRLTRVSLTKRKLSIRRDIRIRMEENWLGVIGQILKDEANNR